MRMLLALPVLALTIVAGALLTSSAQAAAPPDITLKAFLKCTEERLIVRVVVVNEGRETAQFLEVYLQVEENSGDNINKGIGFQLLPYQYGGHCR
ncbi:MAG: hypothetical protein WEB00_08545 [Dehalococcoidia bacterium]